MGKQWKRHVSVEGQGDDQYLKVTTPANGNPQGRNDPPEAITIKESDRKGGATVLYTLTGTSGTLSIQNKEMKASGELPEGFTVSTSGNTLTIHDGEDAENGVIFKYYVKLGSISSKDPMIHNQSDGGVPMA